MTLPEIATNRQSLVRIFCEHTGYSINDVLALSFETNIILARNGGKYRVKKDGIEHLAGPSQDPEERM